MQAVSYTEWHRQGVLNRFDWSNDDIRLILLDGGFSWSTTDNGTYSSISGSEVSGSGYVAGGQPLQGRSIATTGNEVRFHCGEVVWNNFQGAARYAAIINLDADPEYVIGLVDFTQEVFGQESPIAVQWDGGTVLVARMKERE